MHTSSILTLATTLLSTTLTLAAPTIPNINTPALSKRQTTSTTSTTTTTSNSVSFTFKIKPWATYQQCGVKKEFFTTGAVDFVSGKCQDIPASRGFQIRVTPTTPTPNADRGPLYVYDVPCGAPLTTKNVSKIDFDGTDSDQKCYVSNGPRADVPWFGGYEGASAKSVCWGTGCPTEKTGAKRRGS